MQYKPLLIAGALALLFPGCAAIPPDSAVTVTPASPTAEAQLLALLTDQQASWNAGDIDGFMSAYWNSPELRFASGGTVTYGWQETRDRYHERYSNRALMGRLLFDDLAFNPLGQDAAVVHGRWALERETDRPWGLFTLVFKQIDGDWKIVSDTTTSAG